MMRFGLWATGQPPSKAPPDNMVEAVEKVARIALMEPRSVAEVIAAFFDHWSGPASYVANSIVAERLRSHPWQDPGWIAPADSLLIGPNDLRVQPLGFGPDKPKRNKGSAKQ